MTRLTDTRTSTWPRNSRGRVTRCTNGCRRDSAQRWQEWIRSQMDGRILTLMWVEGGGISVGLVQDCGISSADALEILQSCTKPMIILCDIGVNVSRGYGISGAQYKTVVSPVLMHWRYHSLAIRQWFILCGISVNVSGEVWDVRGLVQYFGISNAATLEI